MWRRKSDCGAPPRSDATTSNAMVSNAAVAVDALRGNGRCLGAKQPFDCPDDFAWRSRTCQNTAFFDFALSLRRYGTGHLRQHPTRTNRVYCDVTRCAFARRATHKGQRRRLACGISALPRDPAFADARSQQNQASAVIQTTQSRARDKKTSVAIDAQRLIPLLARLAQQKRIARHARRVYNGKQRHFKSRKHRFDLRFIANIGAREFASGFVLQASRALLIARITRHNAP